MSITVRLSGASDREAILELIQASLGENLSSKERAERGFVQHMMDAATVARFQADLGVFIAEENGDLAGFVMASRPWADSAGPVKKTIDAVNTGLPIGTPYFLYGPVAVDARFAGRGVLTELLTALSSALTERFDLGVLFVEVANAKSLAVHRHYGMTEFDRFLFDGREYVVFTFEPAMFVARMN